jgi:serine/threonine protein kinase
MKTVFQQLGPYEIIEAIGHGMAGSVFLARDTRMQQRVALKLVPHGTDHEALEIVDAERWGAELQKQLSRVSTRVPTVYEHGDHESGYYVAMEYLDGENLSTLISRGPLPAGQAAGIAVELCLFLEEAHRFEAIIANREFRSLVHGDLTPRNVRITSGQKVKVLDFGIAKALSLSRKVTRNDFGTLWYLSPERLESGVVDEYADFWAVGVMLYEMVRAARPFQAEDTRRLERLILSRHGAPSLSTLCPGGLESIIAKLLAPNAAERYSSAHAIREDLERFRSGEPTHAEQEGWPRTTDEPETRRTQARINTDDEKTRRSPKSENVSQEIKTAHRDTERTGTENKNLTPERPRTAAKKIRRLAGVSMLVLMLGIGGNEIWVGVNAAEIAHSVETRELEQLRAAWDRYDDLSRQAYLQLATRNLRRSLIQRSTVLADRVIANYRTSLPTVREAHWQSARDALARAVAIAPHDPQLRAALRYCEGHLYRINGEAERARRKLADAQRDLTEAVAAFRESAELRPGWPDPFLGLARTFIYGLQDLDRGADALRQAERNGYAPGERETVQLADGYRLRGDTLTRNARQLHALPQERDYLDRAAEAYRQALNLYLSLKDFSTVGPNIRLVQRALDRVEKRITEISGPETQTVPSVNSSGRQASQ